MTFIPLHNAFTFQFNSLSNNNEVLYLFMAGRGSEDGYTAALVQYHKEIKSLMDNNKFYPKGFETLEECFLPDWFKEIADRAFTRVCNDLDSRAFSEWLAGFDVEPEDFEIQQNVILTPRNCNLSA